MAVGVTACGRGVADLEKDLPTISALVTPAVAGQLDDQGHFVFAYGRSRPENSEITEEQARQLASDWITRPIHLETATLERQHGASIDIGALRPCGRTYYARSPFLPLEPSVRPTAQREAGSWWLFTLCGAHGRPQVWLAVSAKSGSLWEEWRVGAPHRADGGNEFMWRGIPGGRVEEWVQSPEQAVLRAAELTGEVIAAPPELFAGPGGPTYSFWHIVTAKPARARVRGTEAPITSEDFFAGKFFTVQAGQSPSGAPEVAVAADDQPAGSTIYYTAPDGQRDSIFLPRRPDVPFRLTLLDPDLRQR
jgi:hypothetical protein